MSVCLCVYVCMVVSMHVPKSRLTSCHFDEQSVNHVVSLNRSWCDSKKLLMMCVEAVVANAESKTGMDSSKELSSMFMYTCRHIRWHLLKINGWYREDAH